MPWHISKATGPKPAGFIEPCLPTQRLSPPQGDGWLHEIKLDGYRMQVQRRGDRVRLLTRRGADWTERYPWISEAAAALGATSFTLDGEAVCCDDAGIPVFERLHSRAHDAAVFFYAFDVLDLNGEDLRARPLFERKRVLAKLLRGRRRNAGIQLVEHMAGDGAAIYRQACTLGLEGIVSKRADLPYRSGRSLSWIKVRNPKAPAAARVEEGSF